jgi:hypothetical protein
VQRDRRRHLAQLGFRLLGELGHCRRDRSVARVVGVQPGEQLRDSRVACS